MIATLRPQAASQANAYVWNIVFSGILGSKNFALDFSVAKASWNQDSICTTLRRLVVPY